VDRKEERSLPGRRPGRAGLVVERLAEDWRQRAMEPAILHVAANGNSKNPDHHDGERFLHILDGEVKVVYGDETIVLGPGDSLYLDASLPHTLMPASRTAARVLSVSFHPSRNGHATARSAAQAPAPRPRRG
jgi:mannose-6-phosphate isomerase-like protein (cupin superfamily)